MKGATSCLTSDVWSNIKDDSIMSYMVVSKDCCLFLESVSTGLQGHNHQFISWDISCIIQHNTSMMFAGAVTDNTSTNKKAWQLLQQEFSSCYFHGCCSHGLHLLVKAIITDTKTKKNSTKVVMYPADYPFVTMLLFINSYKDVVKFFHNHHVPKALPQELQKTTGAQGLVCPSLT
jgi:cephalosporin-C deacetylase-like acetyl esterase